MTSDLEKAYEKVKDKLHLVKILVGALGGVETFIEHLVDSTGQYFEMTAKYRFPVEEEDE